MRRPIASIWDVPSCGVIPALTAIAISFFLGGLAGSVLASCVGGGGGDSLSTYLTHFLTAAEMGCVTAPALLPTVWETMRWPFLTVLLGFTALGLIGLPILFTVRGFLLAFSIASFVRIFGGIGGFLAFLIFGVSGLLEVPVLFVLGVQSLNAARGLAGQVFGAGQIHRIYGRDYFLRCAACIPVLCVGIILEYFAVPVMVSGITAALLP